MVPTTPMVPQRVQTLPRPSLLDPRKSTKIGPDHRQCRGVAVLRATSSTIIVLPLERLILWPRTEIGARDCKSQPCHPITISLRGRPFAKFGEQ
jgi:hypothetical protein